MHALADVEGTCSLMTFLIFPMLSCSTNPIVFLVLQSIQDRGMRVESSKKKGRETIWPLAKLAFNSEWV